MRILIINQLFDPEPTFKGLGFAKELVRLGHEVEVLTGFPNYPGGKVYPGYRIRPWQREIVDTIPVLRVALWPSHSRSALGRMANYGSFALTAALAALTRRRPDVIYLYHPPGTAALPALTLNFVRGVPFIVDIQDLWPDTLAGTGMVRGSFFLRSVGWFMRLIYRRAAHVAVLSRGIKSRLVERGLSQTKISIIPNWTFEDQVATAEPDLRQRLYADAAFVVLYSGNIGAAQALDVVIAAAESLATRLPGALFVLMGGGIDEARLREAVAARQLTNIRFLDRCSPQEAAQRAAVADALLVHLKDDPLFAITIPSKTQAYLRAGKPILMGVKGDAADLVAEAGAGIAFAPESGEALAAAVVSLAGLSESQRAAMGSAGQRFYREHLSLTAGTAAFAALMERHATGLRPKDQGNASGA